MTLDGSIVRVPGATLAVTGERDHKLSQATIDAVRDGVPENTRRVYDRRWADFRAWCDYELRTPLPATAETLAEYVRVMTETPTELGKPIAPESVKQAMAAIRVRHREAEYDGQPATHAARKILNGYARRLADDEAHRGVRQAPPISIRDLHAMSAWTDPATAVGKRDRLLLVLGWMLAARRSTIVGLNLSDVTERRDGLGIDVRIRKSKTDQEARGRSVSVAAGSYPDTDVIGLLRAWRAELEHFDISEGRLFRSVTYRGHRVGESLSAQVVTRIIRAAARRALLPHPDSYSGHSLRAGFVTDAADKNIPLSVVASHGGWSPRSAVLLDYWRKRDDWENNPTRRMGA